MKRMIEILICAETLFLLSGCGTSESSSDFAQRAKIVAS